MLLICVEVVHAVSDFDSYGIFGETSLKMATKMIYWSVYYIQTVLYFILVLSVPCDLKFKTANVEGQIYLLAIDRN